MSLEVRWSASARRAAGRLDPSVQRRIAAALDRYATTELGDVVRLTDVTPPQHRLRVGVWRVQFTIDREAGVVYVLHVSHRGGAYR